MSRLISQEAINDSVRCLAQEQTVAFVLGLEAGLDAGNSADVSVPSNIGPVDSVAVSTYFSGDFQAKKATYTEANDSRGFDALVTGMQEGVAFAVAKQLARREA